MSESIVFVVTADEHNENDKLFRLGLIVSKMYCSIVRPIDFVLFEICVTTRIRAHSPRLRFGTRRNRSCRRRSCPWRRTFRPPWQRFADHCKRVLARFRCLA